MKLKTVTLAKSMLCLGALIAPTQGAVLAVDAPPKSGTTNYTTHFLFNPHCHDVA